MNRLEFYMYNLNVMELKKYLGTSLADLLVEWVPEGEQIFTEEILIKMILSVYGNRILENSEFRQRLYRTFDRETIMGYRKLFPGHEDDEDMQIIIELMSGNSWGKNDFSYKVLDELDINHEYFEKKKDDRESVEVIEPLGKFYELLDYQFIIRQKILTYVNSKNDETKMLVRMPTGTGKTKTAMHTVINQYIFRQKKKGLVIWIAHTKELLDQAYDTFCNVWGHIGLDTVKTYKLWDKFDTDVSVIDDGFMFIGVQRLISVRKKNQLLFEKLTERCRVVIIDEAHRAGAAETKKVIGDLMLNYGKSKALIGLTATPGRKGGEENEVFRAMFDNKIIDIDTGILNYLNLSKTEADNTDPEKDMIKYFQQRGILAKLQRVKLEYGGLTKEEISKLKVHMTSNGYKDLTPEFLEQIAINKKRNTSIINELIDLNNAHIPTIVFACSVEHGKMLSAVLTIMGIKNGHVFGDMDPIDRKTVIARYKDREDNLNILINYVCYHVS